MKQGFRFFERTNMKSWITVGILMVGAVTTAYTQSVTSDVLRARILIQGVIQYNRGTNDVIHPVQISSSDLVNLALGRVLGTAVPRNQILAFGASPDTNNAKIFVYDSDTASNLATIGQIETIEEVEQTGIRDHNTEQMAELVIPGAGSVSNGITGGDLLLDGKSVLDTNRAVLGFSARIIGVLDTMFVGTFTNYYETNTVTIATNINMTIVTNNAIGVVTNICPNCITNIPVLVRDGDLSTSGKKIGALVE